MKIYFKTNDKSIQYSLENFDKEPLYEYFEFDIDDDYSDYEIELLCRKMAIEYENNAISLSDTLEKELNKRKEFIMSIKNMDKFMVINSDINCIHFSVFVVYRGNFNDERLIESIDINVDEIKDKELKWYDLYLNNKKDNNINIAPVYLEKDDLYFLENNNGKITVTKKTGFAKYYSTDYDKSYIIATQIYCSKKIISR